MSMTVANPAVHHLYIGGEWREAGKTFENRNPADPSELVGLFAAGTAPDVEDAFAAARDGAALWKTTKPTTRAEILFAAAAILKRDQASIAAELTREEGKTIAEARGEVARAAFILRFFAGECAQSVGEVFSSSDDDTFVLTVREPLGVVGVITPWNFPIAIPAWKIAPALAYGNAVIWKPSELTPLCAVRLVEALDAAGLPPGVINLVTGMPDEVGEALTSHRDLDALTFTGSTAVGRAIQAKTAPRGVKVQLEMGGKNPIVVLPDANLDEAVAATVRGAMMSTGQKCSATSRAIVHPSVAGRFVDRLVSRCAALKVGDPLDPSTDLGPLVSDAQRRRVEDYLEVARAERHEVALGGEPMTHPSGGYFAAPTIYTEVSPASRIAREEIFGPVLAVIEADNLIEGLRLANDTEYGLSASVFTHGLGAAMRFAREIRAGVVHINSETTGAEPHVPFGGMKHSSSHSREQGKAAREFFTDVKTIYVSAP